MHMATTSTQLRDQIRQLEEQALALEEREAKEVIERIQVAIKHYRLTPADLFGNGDAPAATAAPKTVARTKPAKDSAVAKVAAAPTQPARPVGSKLKGTKVPPKFKDGNGNIWTGRGSQPKWLATAIAQGKSLQDFAV
jgi:DNA-binding protein H-NS